MLKRAFTLVELVIVMVIIGILGAIALPQLGYFKKRAHVSRVEAVKNNLEKNLNMLRQEENPSLPDCNQLLSTFGGVRNLDDWNIASHDDSCAFTYNKLDRTIVLNRGDLTIEEHHQDHNSYGDATWQPIPNSLLDENNYKYQTYTITDGSSEFHGTLDIVPDNNSIVFRDTPQQDREGMAQNIAYVEKLQGLGPGTYQVNFEANFQNVEDAWSEVILIEGEPQDGKDYSGHCNVENDHCEIAQELGVIFHTFRCDKKSSDSDISCDDLGNMTFEIPEGSSDQYHLMIKSGTLPNGSYGNSGVEIKNISISKMDE